MQFPPLPARALLNSLALAFVVGPVAALADGADGAEVDFAREVRPVLARACFPCHGPDDAQREAELRLDRPVLVKSLELRPGRSSREGAAVGIGEVELGLAAD